MRLRNPGDKVANIATPVISFKQAVQELMERAIIFKGHPKNKWKILFDNVTSETVAERRIE